MQTFMERFAAASTPAVLAAAVLVAAVPPLLFRDPAVEWAYRALVVLVIACPCAIVLAAPVVTLSALTRATREGILVKGARHLEALGKVRAVAFDKTGTLTLGRFRITRVRAAAGIVAHRLVLVEMRDGRRLYRTQGDGENGLDAGVTREQLMGRVVEVIRDGARLPVDDSPWTRRRALFRLALPVTVAGDQVRDGDTAPEAACRV